MKIIILSLLCSMTTLAQAADAKDEVCGNAFFWDELKARALCDIGTSPAGCLHLNALGSVVLGAGAYKMGLAGANAVDSARAIKMFKDIEKLRLVETSSELRRHRSQMKGIDENLPEETRKKSLAYSKAMNEKVINAELMLKKLYRSPYFNESVEYARYPQISTRDGNLPRNLKYNKVNLASQLLFKKLFNDYSLSAAELWGLKNDRLYQYQYLSEKELAKLNDDIAKSKIEPKESLDKRIASLTKKVKSLRIETLKAYGDLYNGTISPKSKRSAGISAAIGSIVAIPILEMMKEPLKRSLCGFNSTETAKAMAEIGAVAVIEGKGKSCRIEIPDQKLFELAMQDDETVNTLPRPVCEAVTRQLAEKRERQERERPVVEQAPACTKDGFKISFKVNGRKYNHEYIKTKEGSLALKSSFFPEKGANDASILEDLPGGAERFNFTINLMEAGTSLSKLDTSLTQWNTFADGDVLMSKSQGIDKAIKYYQDSLGKEVPPTVNEARRSLASGSMSANYIFSVGEQLSAVNKYLPDVVEYCEARIDQEGAIKAELKKNNDVSR